VKGTSRSDPLDSVVEQEIEIRKRSVSLFRGKLGKNVTDGVPQIAGGRIGIDVTRSSPPPDKFLALVSVNIQG